MSGSVMLNDTDIRDIGNQSLRALMAVVNQDTTLFEGSIAYNIRIGRMDASDQEVEQAARAAEIHSFIVSLPDGYVTNVRSEEHTSELQSLMRISYAVLWLKKNIMIDLLNNNTLIN